MGRLNNRAVVRVAPREEGEDAIGFLQGLLTNDVTKASKDVPVYAALLSAQGKTMFDMLVWSADFDHGRGALLECERNLAWDLARRLGLYRLRRAIDIEVDEDISVFWAPMEQGPELGNDPRLPALGSRCLGPVDLYEGKADEKYLAHRLALGVPEGFGELGDILWLETNAAELNGVSFNKGCYIGQENTARMNWRSKVNRRLVVVPLEQSQEKRRKADYPALGLAIDHLRVDDIPPEHVPDWMSLSSEV